MAELNQDSGGGKKGGKVRSKKNSNAKVDLTAMVDLAFLLITFFMLTTSLNKPNAMDVAVPDKNKDNPEERMEIADDRTVTLLLGKDNKIVWYVGQFKEPIVAPTTVEFGPEGIRQVLLQKLKEISQTTGKDAIIVIRPSDESTHLNLIEILDEMKITDVKIYTLSEILDVEKEYLVEQGLLSL